MHITTRNPRVSSLLMMEKIFRYFCGFSTCTPRSADSRVLRMRGETDPLPTRKLLCELRQRLWWVEIFFPVYIRQGHVSSVWLLTPNPSLQRTQTLAAGYMGNEFLSAQSIIMQFAMYTILVPFSIGVAGMSVLFELGSVCASRAGALYESRLAPAPAFPLTLPSLRPRAQALLSMYSHVTLARHHGLRELLRSQHLAAVFLTVTSPFIRAYIYAAKPIAPASHLPPRHTLLHTHAGTIRVGQALGRGQGGIAKRCAYLSTFLAIGTAFCVACLMTALRWTLPRIYSSWDLAIEIAAGVCFLLLFFFLLWKTELVSARTICVGSRAPCSLFISPRNFAPLTHGVGVWSETIKAWTADGAPKFKGRRGQGAWVCCNGVN